VPAPTCAAKTASSRGKMREGMGYYARGFGATRATAFRPLEEAMQGGVRQGHWPRSKSYVHSVVGTSVMPAKEGRLLGRACATARPPSGRCITKARHRGANRPVARLSPCAGSPRDPPRGPVPRRAAFQGPQRTSRLPRACILWRPRSHQRLGQSRPAARSWHQRLLRAAANCGFCPRQFVLGTAEQAAPPPARRCPSERAAAGTPEGGSQQSPRPYKGPMPGSFGQFRLRSPGKTPRHTAPPPCGAQAVQIARPCHSSRARPTA